MFARPASRLSAASSSCVVLCLSLAGAACAEEAPRTLNVSTRVSSEVLAPVNTPTSNLEQTLWARRGKLALGVQWQGRVQSARPDGPLNVLNRNDPPNSLHMGLAVDVSERARVELTRPMDTSAANAPAFQGVGSTSGLYNSNGMRLSLEVKSSKPMAGLRNGLRLAVTSQSQVTLKPRHGGLSVHYNGTF